MTTLFHGERAGTRRGEGRQLQMVRAEKEGSEDERSIKRQKGSKGTKDNIPQRTAERTKRAVNKTTGRVTVNYPRQYVPSKVEKYAQS